MALKPAKATTPPESVEQCTSPDFDFESMVADEILDNLDWQKIKIAIFSKIKQRFFDWLVSGDNSHVNISAFPELAALPSADEVAT